MAWVNTPVFDFEGILHTGSQILYMWLLADDDCLTDSALNPIGKHYMLIRQYMLIICLCLTRLLNIIVHPLGAVGLDYVIGDLRI